MRQQLHRPLFSRGPPSFPGWPTPVLFWWGLGGTFKSLPVAETLSNYLLARPGCMQVFPPHPPWRPSHFALLVTQEQMWMYPKQAKPNPGAAPGSPHPEWPLCTFDACRPVSLTQHRGQQAPLWTLSCSALSEVEGRAIPIRKVDIFFSWWWMAKSMPQARSVLEFHPKKAKGEIYIHPPTTSLSLLPCKSLQMLFFWLVGPAGDLHWSIFLQDTYYMLLEGMRKSEQQAFIWDSDEKNV